MPDDRVRTCATEGHLWARDGACVMCKIPRPMPDDRAQEMAEALSMRLWQIADPEECAELADALDRYAQEREAAAYQRGVEAMRAAALAAIRALPAPPQQPNVPQP